MDTVEKNWHSSQDVVYETNGLTDRQAPEASAFQPSPWQEECLSAADPNSRLGDSALMWFLIAVGLIPVAIASFQSARWGVEPTCGLSLVIFAAYQLIALRRLRS
jgi:hypothetical protein